MGEDIFDLSKREREIMEIVHRLGRATAAEILNEIRNPPTRTCVRTIIRNLEGKNLLRHTRRGATFVYSAKHKKSVVRKSALMRLIDSFFAGSVYDTVNALLEGGGNRLTKNDLNRLREKIDRERERLGE